jgi:hypothetical protein
MERRQTSAREVSDQHHRHHQLVYLGGLKSHYAEIQPRLCSLADVARHHNGQQQNQAYAI